MARVLSVFGGVRRGPARRAPSRSGPGPPGCWAASRADPTVVTSTAAAPAASGGHSPTSVPPMNENRHSVASRPALKTRPPPRALGICPAIEEGDRTHVRPRLAAEGGVCLAGMAGARTSSGTSPTGAFTAGSDTPHMSASRAPFHRRDVKPESAAGGRGTPVRNASGGEAHRLAFDLAVVRDGDQAPHRDVARARRDEQAE